MANLFRNYFSKFIFFCGLILAILIAYSAIFSFSNLNFGSNSSLLDVSAILLITIFTALLLYLLLTYLSVKQHRKVLIFFLFCIVALQVTFVSLYHVIPTTDTGYVFLQAQNLAHHNLTWSHYFVIYPNNVNIAIFWSAIYEVANLFAVSNLLLFGSLVQLFFLDFSIFFLFYALKKFYSFELAVKLLVLSLLFFPFTVFVLPVYNDLISVVILFFSISFFIAMLKSNKAINQVVYFVLLSVSLSLGYFLRNNLIVVMVAILLTIAITGKYSIRHKMIYFSIFALSFVAIAGLFSVAQRTDKVVSQPNSVTPALRYVYMGLNPATQGEINGDDAWRFETQGYSKAQKNIMYRTAISQRLKQYSLPGLSRHLINKVDFMFASGSFDQDLGLLANRDGSISWFAENSFIWTNAFHGFYVLIFILLGLGCITQIRRKQDDPLMLFSVLSIVGVFSFQVLFWEVRDRYMLPMIPFVLLMSTFSLNRFCESDSVHILSGNLNSRNRKYLVPVIFFTGVISILSLMRNLNLADNQNRYMDFVKIQPFQRYAMNDDFNIKPGIGYKFPIHLTKKANLFQLPYRSYSQGFTIQLINNHSGKRYIFKNNQSEIADTFRPGMYSLVIKNNSTKPITTRMIVDTGSARLTSYSSTLSHDSLVPAYEFDAVHNRPIVSQLGIFLLIFIPYVFGCLLVICVWRKNRIANG